ncbi:MAG: hypothetical protein NZ889_02875 [Candidatus Pacearchaeota archaeon]|nr:hypothetical protein [Candidatus Pacearchaeota archaeon]
MIGEKIKKLEKELERRTERLSKKVKGLGKKGAITTIKFKLEYLKKYLTESDKNKIKDFVNSNQKTIKILPKTLEEKINSYLSNPSNDEKERSEIITLIKLYDTIIKENTSNGVRKLYYKIKKYFLYFLYRL